MRRTRAAVRAAVFADLIRGTDKGTSTAELMKRPADVVDPAEEAWQEKNAAKRNEPYVRLDSRFPDIWYRILAHMAADTVYEAERLPAPDRITHFGEHWVHNWEDYCGEWLWSSLFPDRPLAEGQGVPLF